jgi:hypothetical protein
VAAAVLVLVLPLYQDWVLAILSNQHLS